MSDITIDDITSRELVTLDIEVNDQWAGCSF